MSKKEEVFWNAVFIAAALAVIMSAICFVCAQAGCAAQTSTKLLDEHPSAATETRAPTSQTAIAGGDVVQEGARTKNVTNISDPWTGRIAVIMLGGLGIVVGGRWTAKALEAGASRVLKRSR